VETLESHIIDEALRESGGNKQTAAQALTEPTGFDQEVEEVGIFSGLTM
jgi:hypothetical protein